MAGGGWTARPGMRSVARGDAVPGRDRADIDMRGENEEPVCIGERNESTSDVLRSRSFAGFELGLSVFNDLQMWAAAVLCGDG